MGRDKALLGVGGRPLGVRVAAALQAAGAARVVAVGGDAVALEAHGLEVVPDLHPGAGPLGGLLTALTDARTELVVVLACDLPGVDEHSVRFVVQPLVVDPDLAAAWPVEERAGRGEVDHVLHGAWRAPVALGALSGAFVAGERSVRRAAAGLTTLRVRGIEPATLRNANRPDDLLEA